MTSERFPVFYGENESYNFQSFPRPQAAGSYDNEVSFTVNENGNSSPIFNYSGYMTNDAANALLHYFKDMIATIPNNYQGKTPKVFAAHFQYKSWLSVPASRQCKMTVRYYY